MAVTVRNPLGVYRQTPPCEECGARSNVQHAGDVWGEGDARRVYFCSKADARRFARRTGNALFWEGLA